MFTALTGTARFLWVATRGYRLRPWRSPYLRWRLETYAGIPAETIRAADFARVAATERRQFTRFAHWLGEMRTMALNQPGKQAND